MRRVGIIGGGAADRAFLRGAVALMDITAYTANILHSKIPPDFKLYYVIFQSAYAFCTPRFFTKA